MKFEFPAAVPEIPVRNLKNAIIYYRDTLGFNIDWGDNGGNIAGISNGNCRLFLTDEAFRKQNGNYAPVLIWLNVDNIEQVNELFEFWSANDANIISLPESKPWGLYEFTIEDLDGNLFRVFHDFSTPEGELKQYP